MMNAMAKPSQPAYTTARGDAARDRETVLAIWHANLSAGHNREDKFDWFYRDESPWGQTVFHLLRHEPSSTWVGTAAIGRRHMLCSGRDIRAGVLADMTVDIQHRSLGPAMTLQTRLLEAAVGEFDLLYGFPSPAAAAVMRRMGYRVLARIPRFSCVLRHREYLSRHLPGMLVRPVGWAIDAVCRLRIAAWRFSRPAPRVDWSDGVDPRMDELWRQSASRDVLMASRDVAMLQWRFDRFRSSGVRYLLLSDPRDGSLLAWFACQADGNYLHVRDFWSTDAATGVGRGYIAALLRAAHAAGHAAIDIEYAAPSGRLCNWLDQGFVEREHRLVVGRWVDDHGAARSPPDNYHFTAADEDV